MDLFLNDFSNSIWDGILRMEKSGHCSDSLFAPSRSAVWMDRIAHDVNDANRCNSDLHHSGGTLAILSPSAEHWTTSGPTAFSFGLLDQNHEIVGEISWVKALTLRRALPRSKMALNFPPWLVTWYFQTLQAYRWRVSQALKCLYN